MLNDNASHFKLARSVLKIVSFEFATLQYFNSTQCSRNVYVSDGDKQNIVHLVAYIYMLTSNEETSKIEKKYLTKHRQVFLVPDRQASL